MIDMCLLVYIDQTIQSVMDDCFTEKRKKTFDKEVSRELAISAHWSQNTSLQIIFETQKIKPWDNQFIRSNHANNKIKFKHFINSVMTKGAVNE